MSQRHQRILERCAQLARSRGWRLAHSLVSDVHDAEDLLQRSLVVACSKVEQAPRLALWPWLSRIIVLEARNLRRHRSYRRHQVYDERDQVVRDDPIEHALSSELRDLLRSAYRELPELERECLALVLLVGMSRRAAARTLGIDEKTVREHLDRGLSTLRTKLGVSESIARSALLMLPIPALAAESFAALVPTSLSFSASSPPSSLPIWGGFVVEKKIRVALVALVLLLGIGLVITFGNWPDSTAADSSKSSLLSMTAGFDDAEQSSERTHNSGNGHVNEAAIEKELREHDTTQQASEGETTGGKSAAASTDRNQDQTARSTPRGQRTTLHLTDDLGNPVKGAEVVISPLQLHAGFGVTRLTSNSKGHGSIPVGQIHVAIQAPGYAPLEKIASTMLDQPLLVSLQRVAQVRVTVLDGIGAAAEGVPLCYQYLDRSNNPDGELRTSPFQFTGRDGQVVFDDIPPLDDVVIRTAYDRHGAKGLDIVSPEHQTRISLKPDQHEAVTLQLPESARIYGRVVMAKDQPAPGAKVTVNMQRPSRTGMMRSNTTISLVADAQGYFSLFAEPTPYVVVTSRLQKDDKTFIAQKEFRPTSFESLDCGVITLEERVAAKGCVTDVEGNGLRYRMVVLRILSGEERIANLVAYTNLQGHFQFAGLLRRHLEVPQMRALLIDDPDGARPHDIDVTAKVLNGEDLDYQHRPPVERSVRVVIEGPSGFKAGDRVTLSIKDLTPGRRYVNMSHQTTSFPNGSISLPDGRYEVQAFSKAALSDFTPLEVVPGIDLQVRIQMRAAATLLCKLEHTDSSESFASVTVWTTGSKRRIIGMISPNVGPNRASFPPAPLALEVGAAYKLVVEVGDETWSFTTDVLEHAQEYTYVVDKPEYRQAHDSNE